MARDHGTETDARTGLSPVWMRSTAFRLEDFATRPGEQLSLASRLSMVRRPLTDRTLSKALLRLPFMTLRVMFGIHWQALKLWFKGAPFHRAPKYDPSRAAEDPA